MIVLFLMSIILCVALIGGITSQPTAAPSPTPTDSGSTDSGLRVENTTTLETGHTLRVQRHVPATAASGSVIRVTTTVTGADSKVGVTSSYEPPAARGFIEEVSINGTGSTATLRTATAGGSVVTMGGVSHETRIRIVTIILLSQTPDTTYRITGSVTTQNKTVRIPPVRVETGL